MYFRPLRWRYLFTFTNLTSKPQLRYPLSSDSVIHSTSQNLKTEKLSAHTSRITLTLEDLIKPNFRLRGTYLLKQWRAPYHMMYTPGRRPMAPLWPDSVLGLPDSGRVEKSPWSAPASYGARGPRRWVGLWDGWLEWDG